MSKSSATESTAFRRYRGIIFFVSSLILLLIAILSINIYGSIRAEKLSYQIQVLHKIQATVQGMARDLYGLKLSESEDIRSPYVRATVLAAKEKSELLMTLASVLQYGGSTTIDGKTINIQPFMGRDAERVEVIGKHWGLMNKDIRAFLRRVDDLNAPGKMLDLAVDASISNELIIQENVGILINKVNERIHAIDRRDTALRVGMITLSLLYLAFFILYFMRRLIVSDKKVLASQEEMREILGTVRTGLFLLDSELKVGQQYSAELETIIGHKDIGGRDFIELLKDMVSLQDLDVTRRFVSQLYRPKIKENLIQDLNPLSKVEVRVNDLAGFMRKRILDFQFTRVYKGRKIVRVLVNVADITERERLFQRLEEEREQGDLQIGMLNALLNIDMKTLGEFVGSVADYTDRINSILREAGTSQAELREKLKRIFREVHGLKGVSSSLGLHPFIKVCTEFEEKIRSLQALPTLAGDDFLPLAVFLDELIILHQVVEHLYQRLEPSTNNETANAQNTVSVAAHLNQFAEEIAQRHGKKVRLNSRGFVQMTGDDKLDRSIKEITIQLLRNAVIHGIESPEERLASQKNMVGEVKLFLDKTENSYQLTIEDDGRGIDYEAVRRKAVELGLYSSEEAARLSSGELVRLLFSSGFSTYGKADEDAGRGVGLDVVKDRLEQVGGSIKVAFRKDEFTRLILTFPQK